ncbi:MAG TPA: GIY-YIG nuclease family protein [Syntrophorhabdaceae bacterium]|nr:GIY-YIG nuclease family protein [Syntrophorhabdaceae bacterium]
MEEGKETMSAKNWVVYLLECSDGSYYCGATKDLAKRLETHRRGEGSKYVRSRLPFTLAAVSGEMGKTEAMRLEYFVKLANRDQKIRMVSSAGIKADVERTDDQQPPHSPGL